MDKGDSLEETYCWEIPAELADTVVMTWAQVAGANEYSPYFALR